MKKFFLGAVLGTGIGMVVGPYLIVKVVTRLSLSDANHNNRMADVIAKHSEAFLDEVVEIDGDVVADFIFDPLQAKLQKNRE